DRPSPPARGERRTGQHAGPRRGRHRQPVHPRDRRRGRAGRRHRLGGGRPVLRHGPALRSRSVGAPAGRGPARTAAPRVRRVHQGRPHPGAGPLGHRRRSRPWLRRFPPPTAGAGTSAPAGVRRSIEESLRRLGLDRIDIVYLHDPDDHMEQALEQAYPELERLRAEGAVGAIGAGMNHAGPLARFVRETDIDAVLLAGRYTLLDQSGFAGLLPLAAERGVGVVVGGVLNSGVLADPRPGATFDYAPARPDLLARALDIRAVCERHGVPLRAAALHFPLGSPAVTSVLTGARSAAEVRDAAALLGRPVPDALWAELRERGLLPAGVPTPREAG
ncbi:LOW QUALITY PROTEIN: D-threo-aldose 1-dehydrogenase, partial [Streptomyces griseoflavus Tu4000]